jgi:hypothetical protein
MKKHIIIAVICLLALGLWAHPASNIGLNFDVKTQILSVDFDHQVKNPADHYISSIVIKINAKDAIVHNLSAQETAQGGSLVYKLIGVKAGTQIEAISTCNKTGKKSTKLVVK